MSTSMSLKAAIHFGGGGGAATESLLRYCIHPQEVQGRLLPPPTFCSKNFNEVKYVFLSTFISGEENPALVLSFVRMDAECSLAEWKTTFRG